jgi:HEAT repeat protein
MNKPRLCAKSISHWADEAGRVAGEMRRKRIVFVLALAAMATGFLWCWPRGPKEPVYQGKPLTEWIQEFQGSSSLPFYESPRQRQQAARQAIKAIGTNALPWLLFEFSNSESKWRARFNRWADGRLPGRFRFKTGRVRMETAALGLHFLGPDVSPALPALAEYLGDAEHGGGAAVAMSSAGNMALPYLAKAAGSTNDIATAQAVREGLSRLARTNEAALALLLQSLQHTNTAIRESVLYALNLVTLRPDLVVPALTKGLNDPDEHVTRLAAAELGRRGAFARSALPELRRLMTNSDGRVAGVARNAVEEIDPAIPSAPRPEP